MLNECEQQAEKLLGTVNDSCAAVSYRFATFVTVAAYVAITVASTTDEMLVQEASRVTLPLLNTEIPLIGPFGFYTVAPWLIVLLHSDLLLQLSFLSDKLAHFQREVDQLPQDKSAALRDRMPSFYYVQYIAPSTASWLVGVLSGLIMWLTVVVIPLTLLLWIEVRFLPFHSLGATWLQRFAVMTDVLLILCLWRRLSPSVEPAGGPGGSHRHWRTIPLVKSLLGLVCVLGIGLSILIGTVPLDARRDGFWFVRRNLRLENMVLTADPLPVEDINALRDGTPEKQQEALRKVSPLSNLKGRDLRYANFYNAIMPRMELRARREGHEEEQALPAEVQKRCEARRECTELPECEDKMIARTQLTGANFSWAQLQGVLLDDANLEGAAFAGAQVQDGSLNRAVLNSASLRGAKLQGARLAAAKLCSADLSSARLEKADLSSAVLRQARLQKADLSGANLQGADLRGADLSGAILDRASLRSAQLEGAVMRGVSMQGADLTDARMDPGARSVMGPSGGEENLVN